MVTLRTYSIQGLCNNMTGSDQVYVREVTVHPVELFTIILPLMCGADTSIASHLFPGIVLCKTS